MLEEGLALRAVRHRRRLRQRLRLPGVARRADVLRRSRRARARLRTHRRVPSRVRHAVDARAIARAARADGHRRSASWTAATRRRSCGPIPAVAQPTRSGRCRRHRRRRDPTARSARVAARAGPVSGEAHGAARPLGRRRARSARSSPSADPTARGVADLRRRADARARIAQALLDRGLSADRTHRRSSRATASSTRCSRSAAMYAGVPYAPSRRRTRCWRATTTRCATSFESMQPGLVFAADGVGFEPALRDVAGRDWRSSLVHAAARRLRATPIRASSRRAAPARSTMPTRA